MQGWPHFIPTASKIEYINSLLQVGFDTIDFGSFVSPKAIPQMADTREVLQGLTMNNERTKLLAIIANTRGAEEATSYEQISYLGFPFSVSETFQQRNTNSSIEESFRRVDEIQAVCVKQNKQLVVYLSMGFGNPYGDPYSETIVYDWATKLTGLGITILSLADTVGVATPEQVQRTTAALINALPDIEIGVHLHSTAANWKAKLDAAVQAGCQRFDGALKGIGGCPMAGDELVGNMNMELMIDHLNVSTINKEALDKSLRLTGEIFV